MIYVENLVRKYAEVVAVDNISFNINHSEVVGFLGPNAAGKTTTMKILTCYLPPTTGAVKIAGYDVSHNSMEIRKITGYLPENNPLYEELTVFESLNYIGKLHQLDTKRLKKRISEVVDICGLQDVFTKEVAILSKGYKQRLGFAQAILHDPQILIMDEPTSGLDPNQVREIRNLIKELKKEKTVILSTHILSEVQASCDRAIIIHKGKIVADGTIQQLQDMAYEKTKLLATIKGDKNLIYETFNKFEEIKNLIIKTVKDSECGVEIELSKGVDIRQKIFETCVSNKWILLEMFQEKATLEEVFRLLTQ